MPQAPSRARSSPLQSPLHLLHRASQRADSLFSGHAGNSLTPRQFVVLQAVAEADGLSQTGIMAATGIDRSSTADLVRRLVSHGWLQRRRTKRDARLYSVRLTSEGRRAWSQAAPAVRATEDILLSPLAPAERAAFLEALATIVL
jgi:MarR family transcriptional regulator, temperature-dependent positive regulator of motility